MAQKHPLAHSHLVVFITTILFTINNKQYSDNNLLTLYISISVIFCQVYYNLFSSYNLIRQIINLK